jgi:hypothetical protein
MIFLENGNIRQTLPDLTRSHFYSIDFENDTYLSYFRATYEILDLRIRSTIDYSFLLVRGIQLSISDRRWNLIETVPFGKNGLIIDRRFIEGTDYPYFSIYNCSNIVYRIGHVQPGVSGGFNDAFTINCISYITGRTYDIFEEEVVHTPYSLHRSIKAVGKHLVWSKIDDRAPDHPTVDIGMEWVSQSGAEVVPEPEDRAYFFGDTRVGTGGINNPGLVFAEIPVVIYEGDYVSSSTTSIIIPHPAEPPSSMDYIKHLTDRSGREPIGDTGYMKLNQISPVVFKDPDRNGDGQIDVSDLVIRINEVNTAR